MIIALGTTHYQHIINEHQFITAGNASTNTSTSLASDHAYMYAKTNSDLKT